MNDIYLYLFQWKFPSLHVILIKELCCLMLYILVNPFCACDFLPHGTHFNLVFRNTSKELNEIPPPSVLEQQVSY